MTNSVKRIKPAKLEPGMTIGVIAPAGANKDLSLLDRGVAKLEKLGYRVKLGRHTRSRIGYLAADDKSRLGDLHALFADRKVDAIMCSRGGYGTMRLLPEMDFELIRKNPKIFIGFSDITALGLAFLKKVGLVTFNGPMVVSTFGKEKVSPFSVSCFLRTVTSAKPAGSVWQGHRDRKFRVVTAGKGSGILTGGNLSLVASTVGTPYEVETKGKIVFLEDVDETPYRIDRYLTQLMLAGKLRDARAIVFGRNVPDAESAIIEKKLARKGLPKVATGFPRDANRSYEQVTDEVIVDRLKPLGIPVLIGLPFGHISEYATIPLGVRASVDTKSGDLVIEEGAVV
ncbi:MAG: LD-carboxypeptidase [Candidatus Sumerlaeaceae bacterium]|nr:LD-carboxypeptidase [Candidatus Sumerlaeaceae bacterium]